MSFRLVRNLTFTFLEEKAILLLDSGQAGMTKGYENFFKMDSKKYISADALYADSYRLAHKVLVSTFKPDFIVALWRGGAPIGIIVQEYLAYHGVDTDHIAIRTSAYESIGSPKKSVAIHGTDYLLEALRKNHRLLLIDDVFDTGLTHEAVLEYLKKEAGDRCPQDIKIATLYYKPKNRKAAMEPDFYIHNSDAWLVFPHELSGLSPGEIEENKPAEILPLLRKDNLGNGHSAA